MHPLRRTIAALLLCLGSSLLHGQSYYYINDAHSLALGGASSCLESTLHSAGGVWSQRKEVAASFSKWTSISSINHFLVHATHPIGRFQLQAIGNVLTTSTYSETAFNLGGGLLLHPQIALGISLNYHGMNAFAEDDNYDQGMQQAVSASIALQYRPIPSLTIGCLANNLVQTSFGSESDENFHPALYLALGAQYELLPELKVIAELSQYQGEHLQYRLGLEYYLLPNLPLRVGFYAPESSPTVGLGYYFNRFRLDASFDFNERLGPRVLLGFAYRW